MKRTIFTLCLITLLATAAQAQIVGATDNSTQNPTSRTDNSPVYRPTGGSLRFSAGLPAYFSVAYNHFLTSSFMFGGGLGLGECEYTVYVYQPAYTYGGYYEYKYSKSYPDSYLSLPVFVETELRTPRYKWSLFLNLKMGVNINLEGRKENHSGLWTTDYYGNPVYTYDYHNHTFLFVATAGVTWKDLSLGVGYSNTWAGWVDAPIGFQLSYNLPVTALKRGLF